MTADTAGGTENIAIGNYAGDAITSGDKNVMIGHNAGTLLTTGSENTGVGNGVLDAVTTGNDNTAVGKNALGSVTTSNNNVGIGENAGGAITTGHSNTCVGFQAGAYQVDIIAGTKNVILGMYCYPSASDATQQIVMGYNVTGGANSRLTFGHESNDSAIAFGETSITAPSDIRLKENINDSTAGLSFINDLRPVTFNWKKEKDIPEEMVAHKADSEERFKNDFINHGFIAQEVKETMDNHSEIKDGFAMWSEDDIDGRQRIGDGALVPMLVKSIQELSAKNDSLETSNQALIARIEALENA
jgi:hypothetical protein